MLELTCGRPREAMQQARRIRDQVDGLRALEVWRYSVIAGSHLALGDREGCRQVLLTVLRSGALEFYESLYFPAEVRRFAEDEFDEWPRGVAGGQAGFELFPSQGDVLTTREQEVLRELASGKTRDEVARSQFVSLNTLKAHLRSVYRKLGVTSRAAAVLEAERRGIV